MEMQARLFALICKGELTLPATAEMERVACIDRVANLEQFDHHAYRVRSLVDYHHYMDDMAGLIGCKPSQWKYLFSAPHIYLALVFATIQGTQFRLQGPGNKESLARKILIKLPIIVPTPIIKASLRRILADALRFSR